MSDSQDEGDSPMDDDDGGSGADAGAGAGGDAGAGAAADAGRLSAAAVSSDAGANAGSLGGTDAGAGAEADAGAGAAADAGRKSAAAAGSDAGANARASTDEPGDEPVADSHILNGDWVIDRALWYMQPQYSCVKVRVWNLCAQESSATCVPDLPTCVATWTVDVRTARNQFPNLRYRGAGPVLHVQPERAGSKNWRSRLW